MIYKSDGTLHKGPREDWGGWDREAKKVTRPGASLLQWMGGRRRLPKSKKIKFPQVRHERIKFGDRFIQFGKFRIGEADETHFSISHKGKDGETSQTIQIFRSDGTLHPGPRTSHGLWDRETGAAQGVTFGDRFVQIGNFRIGDVDSSHFSVSHVQGQTIQVFRSDGTTHPGTGDVLQNMLTPPVLFLVTAVRKLVFELRLSIVADDGDPTIQLHGTKIGG
ncbi:hypothetical protein AK812_SmicGene42064, partial [Symbiodinium microadriaticum]